MTLKLYNTLTQTVEPLSPLEPGRVRMYACGPTVYHFVHIGNFRTFVFQDILRRYLRYRGYEVLHVMNITDVDDKIIENAIADGQGIGEYTQAFTQAFLDDARTLAIEAPDVMPRATDHIDEMTGLILRLREKGLTYESGGSTYFRIDSFPGYGKLSRLEKEDAAQGGRIDSDEYGKENPRDFVLWKARKENEAYWDTPLGPGRPGWHAECSAMSMKYLGETFDLHCGGVDLVFPHHENEIAQSEGATGKPFVRHWVHSAHLIVDGEKMSKSRGNFFTLRDLKRRGCNPRSLRFLLSSVHYRKQLNFTFEGVEQAGAAIRRVDDLLRKLRSVRPTSRGNPQLGNRILQARRGFESAMDDDLNVAEALGALFELVREANISLDNQEIDPRQRDDLIRIFADVNTVFEVFQLREETIEDSEILELIEARRQARLSRDFQRADEIRINLEDRGIHLEDTKEGTRWRRAY